MIYHRIKFRYLAEKYGFTKTHLGQQDWFNLFQFEYPNLIYVLPCEYNLQMDTAYQRDSIFQVKLYKIRVVGYYYDNSIILIYEIT